MSRLTYALVRLLLALAACEHDSPASPTGGTGSGTGTTGGSGQDCQTDADCADPDNPVCDPTTNTCGPCVSDGAPVCDDGLSPCEGECVDLDSDWRNCGICGRECELEDSTGLCEEGHCTSVWSPCIDVSTAGVANCDEYCTSIGEACGSVIEPYGTPCYAGFVWFGGEGCYSQHQYYDPENPETACTVPLATVSEGTDVLMSVRCCCTQYGGA